MGACAITTTGFPSIACSVVAVSMLNLGRIAQDLLQWSTMEFGYLLLRDGYVQISGIMPQKRNPVPFEHVRILASRALTQAHAVIGSLHNTPFADINDGENDLQPLVYTLFDDAVRSLRLSTGVLEEVEFRTERMAANAEANF
jgi:argininosuccinate lyase